MVCSKDVGIPSTRQCTASYCTQKGKGQGTALHTFIRAHTTDCKSKYIATLPRPHQHSTYCVQAYVIFISCWAPARHVYTGSHICTLSHTHTHTHAHTHTHMHTHTLLHIGIVILQQNDNFIGNSRTHLRATMNWGRHRHNPGFP